MSIINFFLTILAMIAVLGPLVALHEWGHYIVARMCGVKVLTYSIGFGKELISWTSPKTGIKYCVSMIPLGGFVKMLDGRVEEVAEEEKHLAFDSKHPLKKIAIVLAGPFINFLIAIVLFWVLFMTPNEQLSTKIGNVLPESVAQTAGLQVGDTIVAIDGDEVVSWEEINYKLADRMGETATVTVSVEPYHDKQNLDQHNPNTITSENAHTPIKDYSLSITNFMQGDDKGKSTIEVLGINSWLPAIPAVIDKLQKDGAAERQGMLVGDEVIQVNDELISDWFAFQRVIKVNPEKSMDITVLRNGENVVLDVMPQGHKDKNGIEVGYLGVSPKVGRIEVPADYKTTISYEPLEAGVKSLEKTAYLSYMTLKSMGKMLVGMIGLENLSGPITIAQVAKQSFDINWQTVLSTTGLISLSLAVLNLLPIPILDGGHFMFYLIELIRGKPVSEKTQIIGFNIGFAVMMSIMLLAIGLDVSRLF